MKKAPMKAFRDDLAFCSNFHPAKIVIQGIEYPTAEHVYVAAKTTDLAIRKQIAALPTAGKAKRFGKTLPLRPDWQEIRLATMEYIIRQKFCQNPHLAKQLKETGDRQLVEVNGWNDTFWGVCNGSGANNLGKILMKIRKEI